MIVRTLMNICIVLVAVIILRSINEPRLAAFVYVFGFGYAVIDIVVRLRKGRV